MSWDNFESRLTAVYGERQLTPWPLLEATWLRGECRRALDRRHSSLHSDIFQRVEETYGIRLSTLTDALTFLDQQVEVERRRARDRAARYKETV